MSESDPRFPIGRFVAPARRLTSAERSEFIRSIDETPRRLRQVVDGLDESQLSTPYREGGWSVRQVVHHVPDSHLNSYIRFKLALTEEKPTIKPYDEAQWAELDDARNEDVDVSLLLLETLHRRWVRLLRSLDDASFARQLTHPDIGLIDLDHLLALYAWHGRHHVGHIAALRQKMGW